MSNLTIPNVIAGSALDLEISFIRFGESVKPQIDPSFSLLAQREEDLSQWIELLRGEIISNEVMQLTINGKDLHLVKDTTLNRILRIDYTDSVSTSYISLISFEIQPLPTVVKRIP